jgi:DNA-directed RNA polymerase subunit E'/Rpb7
MEIKTKNYNPLRMKKRETRLLQSIYSRSLLTRNIIVPIVSVGKNIVETFEKHISKNYDGKCLAEGFVKPGSSKIITYSSGLIQKGTQVSFQVVFECEICFPVEGMLIQCVARNITKAGIRAESPSETPSPIVVFIARDHNFSHPAFANIQEDDAFTARVIGQRFELNDKYVSIIAELVVPRQGDREREKTFIKGLEPIRENTGVSSVVPKKRAKKMVGKIVLEPSTINNVEPQEKVEEESNLVLETLEEE